MKIEAYSLDAVQHARSSPVPAWPCLILSAAKNRNRQMEEPDMPDSRDANVREAASVTETGRRLSEASAETMHRTAQAGTDTPRQGAETSGDLMRRFSDMISFDAPETEDALRYAGAALQAANKTATIVTRNAQEAVSTWAAYSNQVVERRVDTWWRLASVRSPAAAFQLQGEHLRAEVELFVDHATRTSKCATDLFQEAGDNAKGVFDEAAQAAEDACTARFKAAGGGR